MDMDNGKDYKLMIKVYFVISQTFKKVKVNGYGLN